MLLGSSVDCCHSGTLLDYGQINLPQGNAAMAGQYSRESVHRAMQVLAFTFSFPARL